MRGYWIMLALAALVFLGCGAPKSQPLPPDQRLNRLKTRMETARQDLAAKQLPDFEDLDRTASQFARSVAGSPKETDAKSLVEKFRELGEKVGKNAPFAEISKGMEEAEKIFDKIK